MTRFSVSPPPVTLYTSSTPDLHFINCPISADSLSPAVAAVAAAADSPSLPDFFSINQTKPPPLGPDKAGRDWLKEQEAFLGQGFNDLFGVI